MIKIGILGEIGSGKSYVAQKFGYPVFNADYEVAKLYQSNKKIFHQLKKSLPKYICSFPIEKKEISKAILANKNNLKKIVNIVHAEVRKKMNIFLNKHKNKKIVILDIPLLLENRINKKEDNLNLDFSSISGNKFFYDVIYNPGETNFLKTGRELGSKTLNGKLMFIYQAFSAFTIWHQQKPEINETVIKLLDL